MKLIIVENLKDIEKIMKFFEKLKKVVFFFFHLILSFKYVTINTPI